MAPLNILSDPAEVHFMVPSHDMAIKSSNWECDQLELTVQTYHEYYNQCTTSLVGTGDLNLTK